MKSAANPAAASRAPTAIGVNDDGSAGGPPSLSPTTSTPGGALQPAVSPKAEQTQFTVSPAEVTQKGPDVVKGVGAGADSSALANGGAQLQKTITSAALKN